MRKIYPCLYVLSFLFLSAGIAVWIYIIKEQMTGNTDSIDAYFIGYFFLILTALITSSFTIMARSGARWRHVSFFLVYLPLVSIVIPVVGTAICAYCLAKISKPVLPLLKTNTSRKRGSIRIPSKMPRIYQPVPLYKSNIAGISTLSFIICTHVLIIVLWIIDAVGD